MVSQTEDMFLIKLARVGAIGAVLVMGTVAYSAQAVAVTMDDLPEGIR